MRSSAIDKMVKGFSALHKKEKQQHTRPSRYPRNIRISSFIALTWIKNTYSKL